MATRRWWRPHAAHEQPDVFIRWRAVEAFLGLDLGAVDREASGRCLAEVAAERWVVT